jgi:hypothetical protein
MHRKRGRDRDQKEEDRFVRFSLLALASPIRFLFPAPCSPPLALCRSLLPALCSRPTYLCHRDLRDIVYYRRPPRFNFVPVVQA